MEEEEEIAHDTNEEVRRRRLAQLAEEVGGLDVVGGAAGVSAQNLDHILKRRKGARRQDGTQKPVGVGDDLARRVERAFGLRLGWMDWPFAVVPFQAWARLKDQDRGFAQAGLLRAIKERGGDVSPEKIVAPPAQEWPSNSPDAKKKQRAKSLPPEGLGVPGLSKKPAHKKKSN